MARNPAASPNEARLASMVADYASSLRKEARELRRSSRMTNADSMLSAAFETVADRLKSILSDCQGEGSNDDR